MTLQFSARVDRLRQDDRQVRVALGERRDLGLVGNACLLGCVDDSRATDRHEDEEDEGHAREDPEGCVALHG